MHADDTMKKTLREESSPPTPFAITPWGHRDCASTRHVMGKRPPSGGRQKDKRRLKHRETHAKSGLGRQQQRKAPDVDEGDREHPGQLHPWNYHLNRDEEAVGPGL